MRSTTRLQVISVIFFFLLAHANGAASQFILPQFSQNHPNVQALQVEPVAYPSLKYAQTFGEFQVPYYDEPTHLNFPGGVAVDGDRVWITEYVGKRALLYNSDGTFVKKINRSMMYLDYVLAEIEHLCDVAVAPDHNLWLDFMGTVVHVDPDGALIGYLSGEPQMSYNCKGLAIDEAGQLFISDSGTHKVYIFDSSGSYLQTIGTLENGGSDPLEFSGPEHLAVRDGTLYVAEDGGNERVQIIDVSNLPDVTYIGEIREFMNGVDLDQLNHPFGVNVDETRIFVADSGNNRVLVFDRNTRDYLSSIGGGQGAAEDQWNNPSSIAVDASGKIYISDMNNHRVKQYDSTLTLLRTFGETGVAYNTDGKHFMYPWRLQADHQGNVYISETRAHRVVKVNAQGTPIFSLGETGIVGDDTSHFNNPYGLAVDSSNRLYVVDQGNHRILVFDQDGNYVSAFGTQGSGDDQLNYPSGVAIGPNNRIYVADSGNFRVQVFDANWVRLGTIGVTGESGSDNLHFSEKLEDLGVDSVGNVYVSDDHNNRVQKCTPEGDTSSYTCATFVGETGVKGEPFYHFRWVNGIGVDPNDRVYIVDYGSGVVTIFKSDGTFVGTLGGHLLPGDVTIAPTGETYVAVSMNQTIVKYAPADLDWSRVSIENFGDSHLGGVSVLAAYNNRLYAGFPHTDGVQVWSMDTTGGWQKEEEPTISNPVNQTFASTLVFGGNLYMGTVNTSNEPIGGQLLRSNGTNWDNVAGSGFSDSLNYAISALAEFNGKLYAGTSRGDMKGDPGIPAGAHIWRSSTGAAGDWTKVLDLAAQGLSAKYAVRQLAVYNSALYALIDTWNSGTEVWRSPDGSTWTQVVASGSGMGGRRINAMEVFNGFLYFGASASRVAQVWRCQVCENSAGYMQVAAGGFNMVDHNRDGWVDNRTIEALEHFQGYLYAWTRNTVNGSETWRSRNGTYWEQYNAHGLGLDADSEAVVAAFNNTLYAGTGSSVVWEIDSRVEVYKSGSGSGRITSSPAGIDCGAACAAEFAQGETVTLTAAAAAGSTFTGWSGEGCSGTGTCVVNAGQWKNVTANFTKQAGTVTLTVNTNGDGMGLVSSLPAGIICGSTCQFAFPIGTVVTLAPQAQVGAFSGWSGACSGSGACQLTLSANLTVSAIFTAHAPILSDFARTGVADADLYFTPADFESHFGDTDGDNLLRVKIISLPAVGSLKFKGVAVSAGQEFAYDHLAYLFYQPPIGYTGSASFTWTGSDGFYNSIALATVSLSIEPDLDGDGIGDWTEANVPPLNSGGLNGDGNGDGILDNSQPNVTSLAYEPGSSPSLSSQGLQAPLRAEAASVVKYLTLELDDQFAFFDAVSLLYPSGNPPRPEISASFPIGFIEFTIKDITPGSAVNVTLFVKGSSLPDGLLGYGAEEGDVKFHWYDFTYAGQTGVEVERLPGGVLKYTLHYVDGLKGDDDLTANGFIKATFGAAVDWRNVYLPAVRR